jgi:RNA polymerase sigma-70 factor (ECF subfamily)
VSHVIDQEQRLTQALKEGQKGALKQLYDQYSPALLGVIVRIVRQDEAAEEILQNVFLKVWNNIDAYDSSKGRLFTWMMNIARNASIDHLRSKQYKQNQSIQGLDENVSDLQEMIQTPNFDYIGLDTMVNALDARQQEIIDLIYFQGYTHVEASEALRIPLGTVKSRVRSAVMTLRKRMS